MLSILLIALFVWWGMHFPGLAPSSARADTFPVVCSATPTPTPIVDGAPLPSNAYAKPEDYDTSKPELEILPSQFQNPDQAVMAWIQYGGVDAQHKKPGVIVIEASNWNTGRAEDVAGKARNISQAGFFAASVYYELAPNAEDTSKGYMPGQPSHELDGTSAGWRMKQQVDDIKNYVKAMRADSRCTGWVAVVGGSAGASHAITVALDTNPSGPNGVDWPHWMQNGDDRPNCAVMLSAIYDFADFTPPTGMTATDPKFVHLGMRNYAQVQNPITVSALANLPLNPVNLIAGAISYGWKPIYMFNSYGDNPTAYHQLVTMICRLQSAGLTLGTDYKYLTVSGSQHAWQYWDHQIAQDQMVGDEVIDFLKAQAGLP